MKKLFLICLSFYSYALLAQKPCESNSKYNEFDFWIGDWEVYGLKNTLAGHSKITKILENCVILEEWTSVSSQNGLTYSGKSFNSYNALTQQWQQNWVDNTGGSTEYLTGHYKDNAMQFLSRPFLNGKVTSIRRLTFYKLTDEKVRQHGEISTDDGANWTTEYDLEYRRKG